MGRVFLVEREGPVYRCATCNIQIARFEDLHRAWLEQCEFKSVYNVVKSEIPAYYGALDGFYGHEVSCINCLRFLGYMDVPFPNQPTPPNFVSLYTFDSDKITPVPEPYPLPNN